MNTHWINGELGVTVVLCVIRIVCGRQQESNSLQHLSKMISAILIYLLKFDCTPAFFSFHEVSIIEASYRYHGNSEFLSQSTFTKVEKGCVYYTFIH